MQPCSTANHSRQPWVTAISSTHCPLSGSMKVHRGFFTSPEPLSVASCPSSHHPLCFSLWVLTLQMLPPCILLLCVHMPPYAERAQPLKFEPFNRHMCFEKLNMAAFKSVSHSGSWWIPTKGLPKALIAWRGKEMRRWPAPIITLPSARSMGENCAVSHFSLSSGTCLENQFSCSLWRCCLCLLQGHGLEKGVQHRVTAHLSISSQMAHGVELRPWHNS